MYVIVNFIWMGGAGQEEVSLAMQSLLLCILVANEDKWRMIQKLTGV